MEEIEQHARLDLEEDEIHVTDVVIITKLSNGGKAMKFSQSEPEDRLGLLEYAKFAAMTQK